MLLLFGATGRAQVGAVGSGGRARAARATCRRRPARAW